MPPDVLVGRYAGSLWALVPDPDAPGRHAELRRALRNDGRGALGPSVSFDRIAESGHRAELALELVDGAWVVADDHLLDLVLRNDPVLSGELARRVLAPLDELPEGQRARLLETLSAWLDEQGEARPAASRLHVHVQTVRYRVAQLRDLLGERLDDARGRLELQLALRVRADQSSTSIRATSPSSSNS
jgi:sugar diacid utilization regulator